MAIAFFEYELADPCARIQCQRAMSEIDDLQNLMVGDAGMHKTGSNMHRKSETSESAPSF